jgi:hypothetical protein
MAYGHLENPKTSLETVVPAALQIREELKPSTPVLAGKPESPPKEIKTATLPVAPVAVPTTTTSTSDDNKKW